MRAISEEAFRACIVGEDDEATVNALALQKLLDERREMQEMIEELEAKMQEYEDALKKANRTMESMLVKSMQMQSKLNRRAASVYVDLSA